MIGILEKPVIDVPDLEAGARFWSEVTGFHVRVPLDPHGRFLGLGEHIVDGGVCAQLLLQRVEHPITPGSTHLDFKVRELEAAIAAVEAIGGRVKKDRACYPDHDRAYLSWAVMEDPWGTPFCLIEWLI